MSDIFAMTDATADDKLAAARVNNVDSLADLDSPLFRGFSKGGGMGVMRGFASAADAIGLALAPFARAPAPSYLTGSGSSQAANDSPELIDPLYRGVEDTTGRAVDYWTPRANEVGRAGQVLGGLGEIGAQLAAGGGTPFVAVGASTVEGGKALINQGVDAGTASIAAAIEGATTYAGLRVPIVGNTLAQRMTAGVVGNVVLGSLSRAGEGKVLRSQGYDEQAKAFGVDATSVSTDALTGLLFGTLVHATAPRFNPKLNPTQIDAVLTARNAKSFAEGTAPGTPADLRAAVAHPDTLGEALNQLADTGIVDVGAKVAQHDGASFTPGYQIEASREAAHNVEQGLPDDVPYPEDIVKSEASGVAVGYDVAEGVLTDEQLAQFQGLRSDVPADQNLGGPGEGIPDGAGVQDAGRNGEPLRVFRGAARELVPEDFNPESLGFASGKPAASLGVFFSKSSEQAAQHGPVAEHFLDIRNPKVFKAEDLPGFDSKEAANAFSRQLEAKGHDGIVIDASGVGGPVNYVAFRHEQVKQAPPPLDPMTATRAVRAGVDAALAGGDQARSDLGNARGDARGHEGQPGSPRGPPAPGDLPRQGITPPVSRLSLKDALAAKPEAAGETLPELEALRQLEDTQPDTVIYSGVDADGNPIKTTVAEAADAIRAEYERDIHEAGVYEVVATCFLGHGS